MEHLADIGGSDSTSAGWPLRLLLVSDSQRWQRAVHAAAADIGGFSVATCAAREALIRLAGTTEIYSHILVQPGSAEGWLAELVDLSAASGSSTTEMLLLGAPKTLPPRVGVIRSADRHAVRQALRPSSVTAAGTEPRMHPTELPDALNGAMIETRYQPIVRIADRQPVALEALARLNHPIHGTLLPDVFVPQIENAGLAARLTDLVASRAFADMRGAIGPLGLIMTLNFPLDVLLVPEAVTRLETLRQESGIPASRVAIELTESRPVDDLAALARTLERLRAGRYRVSIDDICPAVPRIQELLALPFTTVKLDKQVVQQSDQPATARFVCDVVRDARRSGMQVIAEGVEDVPTWNRIRDLGADFAQGFLVARPLPATAVPVWFEAWANQPAFG